MASLAVLIALALVAMTVPHAAIRAVMRRPERSGEPGPMRRERLYAVRSLAYGTVGPLLAVTALAGSMVAVDVLTPWSSVATLLGRVTPETATVSEQLVASLQQAEDDAVREARREGRAVGRPQSLTAFFFSHWPLTPVFALVLALALVWMHRRAVLERRRYLAGVHARRRQDRRRAERARTLA